MGGCKEDAETRSNLSRIHSNLQRSVSGWSGRHGSVGRNSSSSMGPSLPPLALFPDGPRSGFDWGCDGADRLVGILPITWSQDERNFAPECYLTFSLLFWLLFWQSTAYGLAFNVLDGSRLFFVDGIPSDAAVKDFIRRVQETKVKVLRRHRMKWLGDIYAFGGAGLVPHL